MTEEQEIARAGRRAAWFWITLVVVFLTLQVAGGAFAIYLATGDPSVAIVPDYHTKAIAWDAELARREASDRLQWRALIDLADEADITGGRIVSVRLVHADGRPVVGVKGEAKLYHHARAGAIQTVALEMQEEGVYVGRARIARDGLWQIELDLQRGADEHFVSSQTIELNSADRDEAVAAVKEPA